MAAMKKLDTKYAYGVQLYSKTSFSANNIS